jgi:hypothetical protein
MVGVWGTRGESENRYAAIKMTIYLTAGAMLSLLGLIAIYQKSGVESFDLINLRLAAYGKVVTPSRKPLPFETSQSHKHIKGERDVFLKKPTDL